MAVTVTVVAEDGSLGTRVFTGAVQVEVPEVSATALQRVVLPVVKVTVPASGVTLAATVAVNVIVLLLDEDHVTLLGEAVTVVVVAVGTPSVSAIGDALVLPTATQDVDEVHDTPERDAEDWPDGSGKVAAVQVVPDKVYAVGAPDDDCPTTTHDVDDTHEMPTLAIVLSERLVAVAAHVPVASVSMSTPELS